MAIHVTLREIGTRVQSVDHLAKLAKAFLNADVQDKILVYFEFENPQALLDFCETVQAIEIAKSVRSLERRGKKLQDQVDKLESKVRKRGVQPTSD